MKFSGNVKNGTSKRWFNYGGDNHIYSGFLKGCSIIALISNIRLLGPGRVCALNALAGIIEMYLVFIQAEKKTHKFDFCRRLNLRLNLRGWCGMICHWKFELLLHYQVSKGDTNDT